MTTMEATSSAAAAPEPIAPHIVTELPGPKARAIIARDEAVASPSLTRAYPLVAESGAGMVVTDVDGNRFLDFAAGIAVCSTGHAHPKVSAAIKEQADRLIHIAATDFYEPRYLELMERLAGIAPVRGEGARLPHQLRDRGGRGRDQARPLPHASAGDHRLRGRIPRPHDGRAVPDQLEDQAASRLRAAAADGPPRAVPARPRLARGHPAATAPPSWSTCARRSSAA